MQQQLSLTVMPEKLAVCRFNTGAEIPSWTQCSTAFRSITYTPDEVSVVVPEKNIPGSEVRCERDWRAIKVDGKLDFNLCGVLSSILDLLSKTSVSIFVISTYDTDYILVKESQLGDALHALRTCYSVTEENRS